jgi:hypothetical protein
VNTGAALAVTAVRGYLPETAKASGVILSFIVVYKILNNGRYFIGGMQKNENSHNI